MKSPDEWVRMTAFNFTQYLASLIMFRRQRPKGPKQCWAGFYGGGRCHEITIISEHSDNFLSSFSPFFFFFLPHLHCQCKGKSYYSLHNIARVNKIMPECVKLILTGIWTDISRNHQSPATVNWCTNLSATLLNSHSRKEIERPKLSWVLTSNSYYLYCRSNLQSLTISVLRKGTKLELKPALDISLKNCCLVSLILVMK